MNYLSQMTDDELVMLYAKGENKAFDTLLNRYQSKLFSYIYYAVFDDDVANDIFQDTFTKVIVSIQDNSYKANGKFQAWVTRIAHNLIMDYFRQNNNKDIVHDEDNGKVFDSTSLYDPSIEMQKVQEQSYKDITAIYQMLPKTQSQIIQMRFYQDMSFKEIAEELGISINTALGRMHYALINMRKIAKEKDIALYYDSHKL